MIIIMITGIMMMTIIMIISIGIVIHLMGIIGWVSDTYWRRCAADCTEATIFCIQTDAMWM